MGNHLVCRRCRKPQLRSRTCQAQTNLVIGRHITSRLITTVIPFTAVGLTAVTARVGTQCLRTFLFGMKSTCSSLASQAPQKEANLPGKAELPAALQTHFEGLIVHHRCGCWSVVVCVRIADITHTRNAPDDSRRPRGL